MDFSITLLVSFGVAHWTRTVVSMQDWTWSWPTMASSSPKKR